VGRIGVFVCHCGENIARTVRVEDVAARAGRLPGVAYATHYPYMCSAPGQALVAKAVEEQGLTGVVVSACSPQLHEPTFRRAVGRAGLAPHLCEIANIREQCSWVHPDPDTATEKASSIVAAAVRKLSLARPLTPIRVPITRRVLVIGAGIAGIRTALDAAAAGHEVVLVEKQPSIGGNMARLSETFPTLDCSQCILTPLMVEASRHPRIELLTRAEVEEVAGFVGNFKVRIRRRAGFVRQDLCTACGDCSTACPVSVPSEFDRGLSWRKAIYIPFAQAVPSVYTLDTEHCLNSGSLSRRGYRVLACERCRDACAPGAIDYDLADEVIEREVGAVVAATGFRPLQPEAVPEYGYGVLPDVVDGLEMERLLSASGPTGGEVRRPSDGKPVKDVVFIQCVGSRDPRHGKPYCSKICCMATAKHALMFRHKVPDGTATVFYMDIRAAGKGYEEFVRRAQEEAHVLYLRGRASRVVPEDGHLAVYGADTLSNRPLKVRADLVVLATAVLPGHDAEFAQRLRVAVDANGFYQEAHPKLRPSETLSAGVFITGAAQGPKDIPDTVAQASAAAAKALELMAAGAVERDPVTARVREAACVGCMGCGRVCPYGAVETVELRDRGGALLRKVARVNPAVCEGCGACAVACRSGSMDLLGETEAQIHAQIEALAVGVPA
jgi:heterodisulfide reductase subunit A